MLMKVAIDDPPLGRLVLHGYPFDRAKFMKSALRQITAALNAAIHSKGVGSDVIWAGLVRRLTKEVFPYNKGVLLLAFSKHLGHIPPIRDFIEGEIRRSQSMYVIPYRTVIRKHLQHGMGGA